jgi:hypothetical protein
MVSMSTERSISYVFHMFQKEDVEIQILSEYVIEIHLIFNWINNDQIKEQIWSIILK